MVFLYCKFKGAVLRYEVGLLLETGDTVWVNGPFACGKWIDLEIFRVGLKRALVPHEKVIAYGGYMDPRVVTPPATRIQIVRYTQTCALGMEQ